jgi:ribonucleoside-diphosphate reductase alpha chain
VTTTLDEITEFVSRKDVPFGPSGETVFNRTYSRPKPDGSQEAFQEMVKRVAEGNMALVAGTDTSKWSASQRLEVNAFRTHMENMALLPAGRHMWATGVKGRQYLFNCHVAGWDETISRHFEFTFLRLMEGGGVGSNYSSRFLKPYGGPERQLQVHIVCDPSHPDYEKMKAAGVLSTEYTGDWDGCFEIEDSREGWAAGMVDLIDTFWRDDVQHTNRVYDVSRVRQEGARLKTFGGTASGPLPFAIMMQEIARVLSKAAMEIGSPFFVRNSGKDADVAYDYLLPVEAMHIDHAIAQCVVAGGNRRSARMSIVEWNDPWIWEFLDSKADPSQNWTTNISVAIDDEFIALVQAGDRKALAIYTRLVEGMLTNGEPGIWNQSLSQVGEVGEVFATNPCGEITLEQWENCNLGHVNLDFFANTANTDPDEWCCEECALNDVDWASVHHAHTLMTRFLIRATYGDVNDAEQAAKLATNRRIGVGHTGVQGFLAKLGIRYSKAPDTDFPSYLAEMHDVVREEARSYAFDLRIPEPVKTTTVAPTGSISKLPGVTEGIHPLYARYFIQRIRFSKVNDPEQIEAFHMKGYLIEDDGYDKSGNTAVVCFPVKSALVAEVEALGFEADIVETQDELSLDQLLAFQEMYQTYWADNAVSFTANLEPDSITVKDASRVIMRRLPRLKGTTIMVDASRSQPPFTRITEEEFERVVRSVEMRRMALQGFTNAGSMLDMTTFIGDGVDEDCANGACPVR